MNRYVHFISYSRWYYASFDTTRSGNSAGMHPSQSNNFQKLHLASIFSLRSFILSGGNLSVLQSRNYGIKISLISIMGACGNNSRIGMQCHSKSVYRFKGIWIRNVNLKREVKLFC